MTAENQREEQRKEQKSYKTTRKKMNKITRISPYLSIITLNMYGLSFAIKIHRVI